MLSFGNWIPIVTSLQPTPYSSLLPLQVGATWLRMQLRTQLRMRERNLKVKNLTYVFDPALDLAILSLKKINKFGLFFHVQRLPNLRQACMGNVRVPCPACASSPTTPRTSSGAAKPSRLVSFTIYRCYSELTWWNLRLILGIIYVYFIHH